MGKDLLRDDRTDALGSCPVCGAMYYAASRYEVVQCRECRSLLRLNGSLVEIARRDTAHLVKKRIRGVLIALGIFVAVGSVALGLFLNRSFLLGLPMLALQSVWLRWQRSRS